MVGSDLTLACVASGNPKPDIFWLKGNLDVSLFGRRFEVLPNGFLRIVQVQEVDEDTYTCVANNVLLSSRASAYLSILSKSPPRDNRELKQVTFLTTQKDVFDAKKTEVSAVVGQ